MNRQLLILLLLLGGCKAQETQSPTGEPHASRQALVVQPPKKLVGIGYQTWFNNPGFSFGLCADDDATNCAWGLPQTGAYSSSDTGTITRHVNQLTDAGVDFLWIDWTNNNDCLPGTCGQVRPDKANLEASTTAVFNQVAALGKPIKIAIALGTQLEAAGGSCTLGNLQAKADQIYNTYVSAPAYSGMYLHVQGKPLLAIYAGSSPSPSSCKVNFPSADGGSVPWNDARFTVRWFAGYLDDQPDLRDAYRRSRWWSWVDRGDPTYSYVTDVNFPEHVSVAPGYPGFAVPAGGVTSWAQDGGRDRYGTNDCSAPTGVLGTTFAAQWRRALNVDPEIVTVTAWNQWMRSFAHDAYNARCTMDIEPSAAEGDFMLQQLKQHVAEFKKYKSHIALRDKNNGKWYFRAPPDFTVETNVTWYPNSEGPRDYQPVLCDFNGDGYVDMAMRSRDESLVGPGTWVFRAGPAFSPSSEWSFVWSGRIGTGYQPFAGDFNGDGTCELGVREISTGKFYSRAPVTGSAETHLFTWSPGAQYEPFVGDFDKDGVADIGFRDSNNGHFYWRKGPSFSSEGSYYWTAGQGTNYRPFVGDFNGDGYWDIGLNDTSIGRIHIKYGPNFAGNQSDFDWAAGSHYQVLTGDIR